MRGKSKGIGAFHVNKVKRDWNIKEEGINRLTDAGLEPSKWAGPARGGPALYKSGPLGSGQKSPFDKRAIK